MPRMIRTLAAAIALLAMTPQLSGRAFAARPSLGQSAPAFDVVEAGLPDIQTALADGRVTSRQLVQAYLARIAAYDQRGPQLNAVVRLNPRALEEADALDRERRIKGPRGPLHGVPILVKDNYATVEMATSGGTLALATLRPDHDARVVQRLRAAGAIVLGKTAMHELAAGVTTVSSLTGASRNPYDPARSPGGSSGGTAAAVAASFAAAGIGTDTCGSIRLPAAYQNLFGLRPTRGLTSLDGVIPLSTTQDVGGPLARTVTDLAIMLDAMVSDDMPAAVAPAAKRTGPYQAGLATGGLKGARIGVLRDLFGTAPEDMAGAAVADNAFAILRAQGADLIEVRLPDLPGLLTDSSVIAYEFKPALARFLAGEPTAPVRSLHEVIELGLDHQEVDARLRLRDGPAADDTAAYARAQAKQAAARALVLDAIAAQRLDALIYPTSLRPAPRIGDEAGGVYPCQLSASTGLPALAMPAGFTPQGLPIGVELLGRPHDETALFRLAYGWEQAAHPRKAPFSTPRLEAGRAPAPPIWRIRTTRLKTGGVAQVAFTYDPSTARLSYAVKVSGVRPREVIAVTLQRRLIDGHGPVIERLAPLGQTRAEGVLTLGARERADLGVGRLFVRLYTEAQPLGAGEAALPAYPAP